MFDTQYKDTQYKQISKQLSEALSKQQSVWGRHGAWFDRVQLIKLIVGWYAEGSINAYGHLYDEALQIILGDDKLVKELQILVDTMPAAIRSPDWTGINNQDDGLTDADRVAMQLEDGDVNFYEYIKHLHKIDHPEVLL